MNSAETGHGAAEVPDFSVMTVAMREGHVRSPHGSREKIFVAVLVYGIQEARGVDIDGRATGWPRGKATCRFDVSRSG